MSDNRMVPASDTVRRAVLILAVLGVLVGIAVADPGSGGSGGGNPVDLVRSAVAVTSGGAESSAWFCAGATGGGGGAQGALLFTNPTPRPVTATVTTLATGSPPASSTAVVPSVSQSGVVPVPGLIGGAVASTVVLDAGGVGVSQVVSGPGFSTAPCASTTSRHWYFADASTAEGSTLTLSLFNPTDTIAVVDVSFVSSTGVLAPPAYQGIEVAGDSMVVEHVGIHVPNNPHFATVVSTLSGTLVAAELQTVGPLGSSGSSIVLGATTPTSTWSFAQSTAVAQGSTVFHVFNPNSRPVDVTVKIGLQQGAAEPLTMRIPATSVGSMNAQSVTRIPSSTAFAVTFVAGRGAGIVVDRHVSSPAGAVSPQQGDTMGVPGGSERWLLPTAYAPAMSVSTLAVVNPNRTPVTVRLMRDTDGRLAAVAGFGSRRVRPGLPLIVTPGTGSPIGAVPVELVASGPVAVEMDALPAGSPGVAVIPALPLR